MALCYRLRSEKKIVPHKNIVSAVVSFVTLPLPALFVASLITKGSTVPPVIERKSVQCKGAVPSNRRSTGEKIVSSWSASEPPTARCKYGFDGRAVSRRTARFSDRQL